LRGWLDQSFLEALVEKAAIVGAHFLCADEKASRTETEEKKLRDRPDEVADWIVLVEGYDEALMRSLLRDKFDPGRLEELGAAPGSRSGLYQLEHIASHDDVHRARLAGSP
ncbi:MAG: hypothetical protein ACR2RL_15590, partial [Gammaproteobacteria bacterium]